MESKPVVILFLFGREIRPLQISVKIQKSDRNASDKKKGPLSLSVCLHVPCNYEEAFSDRIFAKLSGGIAEKNDIYRYSLL